MWMFSWILIWRFISTLLSGYLFEHLLFGHLLWHLEYFLYWDDYWHTYLDAYLDIYLSGVSLSHNPQQNFRALIFTLLHDNCKFEISLTFMEQFGAFSFDIKIELILKSMLVNYGIVDTIL